ncbi:MAG: serine hydrolase [Leptospira sp.]|nr:serine hydrolase [Leptospira sp.]
MIFIRKVSLILLFSFISCSAFTKEKLSETNSQKIERQIQAKLSELADSGLDSVTYAVLYGNGTSKSGIVGNLSLKPDTQFKIGSITKLFTGIAILQLQEQRKLNLDDPISKFIPEVKRMATREKNYREITIRDVLIHRSGLPSDLSNGFFLDPNASNEDILKNFRDLPKILPSLERNEPGKVHSYSNFGFGLLGIVIERAANQSIEEYFQKNIFQKAGMSNTNLLESEDHSKLSGGYSGIFWKSKTNRPIIRDLTAGSLATTGGDLARFMTSFFASKRNQGLLSKKSFDEFHKSQVSDRAIDSMDIGLPVMKKKFFGDKRVYYSYGHSGSLPPFISDLTYEIETETASFLSTNTLTLATGKVIATNQSIWKLVFEEQTGSKPEPPSLPKLENLNPTKDFLGTYVSSLGIHEVKDGNPNKLNFFNFDFKLTEVDNRYKLNLEILFGLITIRDPALDSLRVEFEEWKGEKIFTVYSEESPKGMLGVATRFEPDFQYPKREFFGNYKVKDPFALTKKIKLENDKRGFVKLAVYYSLGGAENEASFACRVDSDGNLRILGYGRNLGEKLVLKESEKGLKILYSGYEFEKD